VLGLALVGCGGSQFSALDRVAEPDGSSDAAMAADGISADTGSSSPDATDAAGVQAGDAEASDAGLDGPVSHDATAADARDDGPAVTPLAGCVAYFDARAKGCACVANYHGCDQQVDNDAGAGVCSAELGVCQASCFYDGGSGSDALCYCLFSCLSTVGGGGCLVPNQQYMTCDVDDCNASNCP
jgi:hypothetical protein